MEFELKSAELPISDFTPVFCANGVIQDFEKAKHILSR